MSEFKIFETLKAAYNDSTPANNRFKRAIEKIKWENTFMEDDEYYFVKGGFCFVTPSLNPFAMPYKPNALFSDGSSIEF